LFFKFPKSIHVLTVLSFIIFLGCTNDESYDNSDFVSEVNIALPDTDNSTSIPFVVVGNNGAIFTSSDGITWDNRSVNGAPNYESQYFNSVTYGNGVFVAVSQTETIYYSTDSITWTKTGLGNTGGTNYELKHVLYADGIFIAVGIDGALLRSIDGKIWVKISVSNCLSCNFNSIAYGSTIFLTHVGGNDYFSQGGLIWSSTGTNINVNINDIIFINGIFIILPDTTSYIYTSSAGSSWSQFNTGAPGSLNAIAYGNGKYVAFSTSNDIWHTSDITSSFTQISGASKIEGGGNLTYRNNIFISVGTSNVGNSTFATIQTSPDGINWTIVYRPTVTGLTFSNVY